MKFTELYRKQIQLTRVYGIPVRIDYRWFVIFTMCVWLIANNLEEGTTRFIRVGAPLAWTIGVITTLGLFLSVFGHELSHALVGRLEGIETEEIILHPFGGLARLRRAPDSPRAEFRIAIAGPAASFLFAVLSFAVMSVAVLGRYWVTAGVLFILGSGNLLLALFNLLPGYPLDGGRILRAWLWQRSGDPEEATRIAGRGGQVIAWTLIVLGTYIAIAWSELFMGLWSILIGVFLLDASSSAAGASREKRPGTRGKTAGDAMQSPMAVEPDTLVSYFIDEILPRHRHTTIPVAKGSRLHGILMLEDLKKLPRDKWYQTRASEIMRPVGPDLFIEPSTPLDRAERLMHTNGTGALAVVNGEGNLVGFLRQNSVRA